MRIRFISKYCLKINIFYYLSILTIIIITMYKNVEIILKEKLEAVEVITSKEIRIRFISKYCLKINILYYLSILIIIIIKNKFFKNRFYLFIKIMYTNVGIIL